MIKEDNLVDTSKLYLTLKRPLYIPKCPEDCSTGQKQEASMEPRVGLAFGWLDCVSGQAEHLQRNKS